MAKRKRDSEPPDTPSIIVSNATSTTTPTKPSKMPCRHMYTNEEHRFIWYHRKTLGMSPNKTHGKFHDYFKPAVRVSLDGLNQLVGRLGRTLPDDVVGVVNTEAWATSGPVGMNEEDQSVRDATDILSRSEDSSVTQRKGEGNRASEGIKMTSTLEPTPSASKHPRHMYTNEQHRFIWFYRNELKMKADQTARMYNDYFGLEQKSGPLNQLSGRLKKTMPPEVVLHKHTEPWATPQERK